MFSPFSPSTWAQEGATAGIYGAIADQQDAAVTGAKITLLDIDRNQTHTAISNYQGQYSFPQIPMGHYRLIIAQSGFKTFEQDGIRLAVNDNRRVDVTLQIGELSTKVTVEAAAAQVETSSAALKMVVDGKRY